MRGAALALALLLAGCGRSRAPAAAGDGARLEAAAMAAGLVPDADGPLTGAYARGPDRMCVAPDGRAGLVLDYGEGSGCAASGAVRRAGKVLKFALNGCRVDAAFDGERVTFPAAVDPACAALCRGNASLAALAVERNSDSAAEAATFRLPSGETPCAD